jgi:hypothetical protein
MAIEWKGKVAPRGSFIGSAGRGDTSQDHSATHKPTRGKPKAAEELGTRHQPATIDRPKPSEARGNRLGKRG